MTTIATFTNVLLPCYVFVVITVVRPVHLLLALRRLRLRLKHQLCYVSVVVIVVLEGAGWRPLGLYREKESSLSVVLGIDQLLVVVVV